MKKRLVKKLAKKQLQKKMAGLSTELQEQLKKAEEGQAVVIDNKNYPRHGYKTGTIVNIIRIDNHDDSADCMESNGSLGQWVSLKDMIIKGK